MGKREGMPGQKNKKARGIWDKISGKYQLKKKLEHLLSMRVALFALIFFTVGTRGGAVRSAAGRDNTVKNQHEGGGLLS